MHYLVYIIFSHNFFKSWLNINYLLDEYSDKKVGLGK